MIVMGLHCGHDGSVSVVKHGRLAASVSQERIDRSKKSFGVSDELIDYVLCAAQVTPAEIDFIALSDWTPQYMRGTIGVRSGGADVPCTWNSIFGNEYRVFEATFRGRELPAYNIGHHVCHAAAAYYTSNFPDAVCLTMDSSGGRIQANSLIAFGNGNRFDARTCPGIMAGVFYGQFCEFLGIGGQAYKAGAMMGLAAYGKPLPGVVEVLSRGQRYVEDMFCNRELAYWDKVRGLWLELTGRDYLHPFSHEMSDTQRSMDLAASMQLMFETAVLRCVNGIKDGPDRLCLGGGSFLNCNVNTRIVKETRFKNVHLFPACGDDGGSAGAALYVAHHIHDEPRAPYAAHEVAYLGGDRPYVDAGCDLDEVAQALVDGKIVAWLQGRGEVGPRALGNSSILADPRSKTHRETINRHVKKREWFRPFAPSVLAEESAKWFDYEAESPFMLHTAKVKSDDIPAVTHVDGTARMQTVTREMNPRYYDLIARFRDLTGVPMVLNTSLNGPGEPIVTRPEDAMKFWRETPVDLMVLDGVIHRR